MDFEGMLAYLRAVIDKDLKGQVTVPPGYLSQAVATHTAIFNVDNVTTERLVRHLETIYGTTQGIGKMLRQPFQEWYPKAKRRIESHYWQRLEEYWIRKSILPVDVIKSVDAVTNEIMGFLGDPNDAESWDSRKGLVMGHVQMGKTTNYSALIAKAADAGYRIIIVLSGMTNSLRYQTQVRLDKSFVGKSSVSDATHIKIYDVATIMRGIVSGYEPKFPYCGTTQLADFNTATAASVGAHEGNFKDPILFVTKKHPKVLEKIADWLKGLRPGGPLIGPMLLIDDEADNASVNTNASTANATEINNAIRKLLATTRQRTYIGYTATPFANIFINPDSSEDMANDDLFPADFIKSLDPPSNYVGAHRLFATEGDLNEECLRLIPSSDYSDLLPLNHKSSYCVKQLPESLKDAVREYVLFRAIRCHEGYGDRDSAMLINVSRFNATQESIQVKLDEFLHEMGQAITTWSRVQGWSSSRALTELHRVWVSEYDGKDYVQPSWEQIRDALVDAFDPIETRLVNMRGGGIDYEKSPKEGLHIIAIGGLALSRGLTLEGLAISYVLRKVGAADTLLQMGRWFGYRPDFERLCRIHTTVALAMDFADISKSVEELRHDFSVMSKLEKTPYDFGMKVRRSSTGIAITAANKMRTAKAISLAEDFSERHVQGHTLVDDVKTNSTHTSSCIALLDQLSKTEEVVAQNDEKNSGLVWKNVAAQHVLKLIKALEIPQSEFSGLSAGGDSLLTSYIRDRSGGELKSWTVAVPYSKKPSQKDEAIRLPVDTGGKPLYCRARGDTVLTENGTIRINSRRAIAFGSAELKLGEKPEDMEAVIAYAEAEKKPETRTIIENRTHPLLLIHFLQLTPEPSVQKAMKLKVNVPIVSISVVLPSTKEGFVERKYLATPRLLAMLNEMREQNETDEELLDE